MEYLTCHICIKEKPASEFNFSIDCSKNIQMCDKCNNSHYHKQQAIINAKKHKLRKIIHKKDYATWQPILSKEARAYAKKNHIYIKDIPNDYLIKIKEKLNIPIKTKLSTMRTAINVY